MAKRLKPAGPKPTLRERWEVFKNPPSVELTEAVALKRVQESFKVLEARYDTLLEKSLFKEMKGYRQRTVLAEMFRKSTSIKSDIIKTVDRHKDTYLHVAAVNLLVQDSVATNTVTNDIVKFKVTVDNSKIQKEMKLFQESIDFDTIVDSIIEDLISYGEYFLKIERKDGEGVSKIEDTIDQGDIVAVYESGFPKYYLERSAKPGTMATEVSQVDPDDYIHFCLGNRKLRVKIEQKKSSEYVRIGRPLFWGNFDLLDSLTLITHLIPASYVQKMNSSSIVGVNVPDSMSPKDAFKTVQQYEEYLNKKISIDTRTGDVTAADILDTAGRFKVLPIYGSKGSLEKVDPRYDEITDIEILRDLRKSACATIGVPYHFLFSSDEGTGKLDTLKSFARYVRKLVTIQDAIKRGFKTLAILHFKEKGMNIKPEWIDVIFTNKLVNVEELDRIEFLDTLISTLSNITDVVTDISDKISMDLNTDVFYDFLNRYLKVIELETLFIKPEKKKPDNAEGDGEQSGEEEDPIVEEPDDSGEEPDGGEK